MADCIDSPLEFSDFVTPTPLNPIIKGTETKHFLPREIFTSVNDELNFFLIGVDLERETSVACHDQVNKIQVQECQDSSPHLENTDINEEMLHPPSSSVALTFPTLQDIKSPRAGNSLNSPVLFEIGFDKRSDEVIEIPTEPNRNLQEAFLEFRKKRQDAIRKERWKQNEADAVSTTHDHLETLRAKVVEQAKKYIGVPYAKKYWSPDSPEGNSTLFLDCCGLVRRVIRDLEPDLGFRLGPWNQAYMYDTLPRTVSKEEMKPGDLVFMRGHYNNPKAKKQFHDVVHVEIWLGEGEKTIGSRWNSAKVGTFDSYTFSPKSFHDEEYIFKSVDTWLMGKCQSVCPEHPWRKFRCNPSTKSVFNSEGEQDQKASPEDTEPWPSVADEAQQSGLSDSKDCKAVRKSEDSNESQLLKRIERDDCETINFKPKSNLCRTVMSRPLGFCPLNRWKLVNNLDQLKQVQLNLSPRWMKHDKINCKSLSGPHRPMTAPHGSVTAPQSPVIVLSHGDATSSCWMSPFVKKIQRDLTIIQSPREHLDNFNVTDDQPLPVKRSTAECPKPRETMHHGNDTEKKPPDLPLFNLETNVGHQVTTAGCGNHAEKHETLSAYSLIEESCAPHTQPPTTVDFRSSSSHGTNLWGSGQPPLSLYIWLRNGSVLIHCYQSWTMDMLNMGVRAWHIYSYGNNEDPSWGQDFSQDVLRFEQVQESTWAQKLELTHTQNSCAYDFQNSHNEYVFDLCTGLHGSYGHTRCGTSTNLNNNSSTKGLDLFASEDISVGETRIKTGDFECLGARKMGKFQNKLPPLMLYRKKAEVTKKLAMKKIIRLENLPVLPMFAGIKDILNTGDSESVHAIVSGSQSSKSSQGDESGKPDSTLSSESSAQTKSDAESIGSNAGRSPKKKSQGRDKSVERCPSDVSADGPRKFKARPSKKGSAKKGAKSQETGQRNPCMIDSLSEVVIGDVSEYVYSQMQGQEKSTGVDKDDDDDDEDEDDDSESESDTESEDEDVESNDYVVLDSSTNMVPWFLRTTVSTEPYVGLEEFFDGYVDDDDDDDDGGSSNNESPKKKKSPTCTSLSTPVIKRNKVSGGTTTQNGRKAVGSGGSNGSGKGKGECTEAGGAKGGSDGKKEKSSEQSGGGGDESSGKDDSSGSGGGKKGNKPPPCTLPTNMQPTFYVSGGNNSILQTQHDPSEHIKHSSYQSKRRKKRRKLQVIQSVGRHKVAGKFSEGSKKEKMSAMFPRMSSYACPDRRPTFYLCRGNNSALVEGPLLELGWKKTTDRHDERYRLKWVENRCRINYIAFREGEQLVNHIPNCKLLTNKLGLLCSLQEYERVTLLTKGRLPRLKMADFVPETYKLDERIDRDRFLSEYKDGETWICKPTSLNQGKGIFLLRSREEINQLLTEREAKSSWTRQVQMRIVQRYIHNPLLIEGRKFDIRAYMFIASTVPFLVLFHNGYVRLSCQKYSQDDTNLTTHLTNQFVQKKDPTYKDNKEDTAWTMEKLNEYINQTIGKEKNMDKDWVFGGLTKQMQRITLHCFNSVKHKLQCKIGYFDLYGMDFMVDSDLKVWLIEINANPALWTNCQALKEAIPRVVRDALYLAIECFDKSRKGQALLPLHSLGGYNVLYCGSNVANGQRQIRSVSPFKDSVDMSRPTGTSPPQNQRRHSPPRVISKTNISGSSQSSQGLVSPPVSSSKLEKKPSSVLPTINIGANVNMTRPGPTGGYSYSKKQQTYEPQQQISRVSMSGSASGEDHKLRMTQADSGSRRSKENRGH